MSNSLSKITTIEAVCFIVISTLIRIVLNLPQLIIKICGSSALINMIYISIIIIFFTLIIIRLFSKFTNYDIVDISGFVGGNIFKYVIGVLICLYLISFSSFLIRNFSDVVNSIYYRETSFIFLILFFIITAFISNLFGAKSIFRVNVIIVTIMVLSFVITFISVLPNIVWQRIFPILGNGLNKTFITGLCNLSSFNGLILIYFICPFLEEKKDFKKTTIISISIISLLLFLSTACLLLSLSFSSTLKDISSFYTLITNNEFGDFFQHPEALFIFTWILSIISFLNLIILFVLRFSKKIFQTKNSRILLIIICIIIFIISLVPQNIMQAQKLENFIHKYIGTPLEFIVFPSILLIANIKLNNKTKKERKYE